MFRTVHTSGNTKAFWKHFSLMPTLRCPVSYTGTAASKAVGNQQKIDIFNPDQFPDLVCCVAGQLGKKGCCFITLCSQLSEIQTGAGGSRRSLVCIFGYHTRCCSQGTTENSRVCLTAGSTFPGLGQLGCPRRRSREMLQGMETEGCTRFFTRCLKRYCDCT